MIVWRAPDNGWNRANIWAPELHFVNGKWYIYYAAAMKGGKPFIYQKSGVLESKTSDAQGEYVDKGMLNTGNNFSIPDSAFWAIDFTLLKLNGKLIWEYGRDGKKMFQLMQRASTCILHPCLIPGLFPVQE